MIQWNLGHFNHEFVKDQSDYAQERETDLEIKSILEDGVVTNLEWQSETWCVQEEDLGKEKIMSATISCWMYQSN